MAKKKAAKKQSSWVRLEYHSNAKNSHKFWQIKRDGMYVWVEWGRLGTGGQGNEKKFESVTQALDHTFKMIEKKEAKGYKKVPWQTPYDEDDDDDFEWGDEEDLDEEEPGFLESRVEETPDSSDKKRLEDLIL